MNSNLRQRMRLVRATAGLLAVVILWSASAASAQTPEPDIEAAERIVETYRVASGDKLQINVFGHPDVSGEFEVDGSGNITFPLLGSLQAAGVTVDTLRERIEAELNRDYLVDPSVNVEVLNYRPFFILGQVAQPGSYAYQPGMTVRQAVALAGGYTRRARTSSMNLIRQTDSGQEETEVDENALVYPGDTIEVERRFF